MTLALYNPETHVVVPRVPTEAVILELWLRNPDGAEAFSGNDWELAFWADLLEASQKEPHP